MLWKDELMVKLLRFPPYSTFVCPTEILAFSDRVEEFKNINTEVIACSIDSHFTHLAWINTPRKEGGLGKINIPLLSDMSHRISKVNKTLSSFYTEIALRSSSGLFRTTVSIWKIWVTHSGKFECVFYPGDSLFVNQCNF